MAPITLEIYAIHIYFIYLLYPIFNKYNSINFYIKRKGKYLSISNNLTQGYEDLCIDKDSIKGTHLKYYIYENNDME